MIIYPCDKVVATTVIELIKRMKRFKKDKGSIEENIEKRMRKQDEKQRETKV